AKHLHGEHRLKVERLQGVDGKGEHKAECVQHGQSVVDSEQLFRVANCGEGEHKLLRYGAFRWAVRLFQYGRHIDGVLAGELDRLGLVEIDLAVVVAIVVD